MESSCAKLRTMSVTPQDEDVDSGFDPDAPAVVKLLNSWIRSEMSFRGRQVYRLHTAEDDTGIDRIRYLILRQLVHDGPGRLSDVAEAVSLTLSHASRVVNNLVELGLVARTVPDVDRRVKMLDVTAKGRDLMRTIEGNSRQLIAERLACAGFTDDDAIRFADYYEWFANETQRWAAELRSVRDASPS